MRWCAMTKPVLAVPSVHVGLRGPASSRFVCKNADELCGANLVVVEVVLDAAASWH